MGGRNGPFPNCSHSIPSVTLCPIFLIHPFNSSYTALLPQWELKAVDHKNTHYVQAHNRIPNPGLVLVPLAWLTQGHRLALYLSSETYASGHILALKTRQKGKIKAQLRSYTAGSAVPFVVSLMLTKAGVLTESLSTFGAFLMASLQSGVFFLC